MQEIIDRGGRHPLAVAMAAARAMALPGTPLAQIVADLPASQDRLDGFDNGTDNDLPAIFSWSYRSYRALTPAAARLFRLIPLHPDPEVTPDVAA